ncbi:hypothetical protein [Proteiniphilum sp.]|uniref:ATP-grasp domain-containing protein n=1 Tax=Proteiniphilum sp. TaxID=1926877 RepID=UPI00332BC24B
MKELILSLPFFKQLYLKKRTNSRDLIPYDKVDTFLNEAEKVLLDNRMLSDNMKIGIVKDGKEPNGYTFNRYYYPKYARFLKNNNIDYIYYDIYKSDWISKAKEFDLIIWHTASDPITQDIALNKIYILDKILKKKCLPSFDEIWSYENKVNANYLYEVYNLPTIPTFISFDEAESLDYISKCDYPIISKSRTASASAGVKKITTPKKAYKLVKKIFSSKGLKTNYFHDRQKNYVYFQNYIKDATYDLRVITIGKIALGYYRYPKKGDFRASGAGIYEKKMIPDEALKIAFKVKDLFGATCLATDLLYSEHTKQYYIIESSIFIGVDTPRQLEINGISGYYELTKDGSFIFKEGRFWIQELTLKSLLEDY